MCFLGSFFAQCCNKEQGCQKSMILYLHPKSLQSPLRYVLCEFRDRLFTLILEKGRLKGLTLTLYSDSKTRGRIKHVTWTLLILKTDGIRVTGALWKWCGNSRGMRGAYRTKEVFRLGQKEIRTSN